MFTAGNLIGGLLFSSIGLVAILYGKKQERWQIWGIGILLTGYPLCITETWMMYAIGVPLTAALFFFRE